MSFSARVKSLRLIPGVFIYSELLLIVLCKIYLTGTVRETATAKWELSQPPPHRAHQNAKPPPPSVHMHRICTDPVVSPAPHLHNKHQTTKE